MRFLIYAGTEKGNYRSSNQDSICVRKAKWKEKQIVMAIVCDGMGGLSKGEVASAKAVQSFAEWFDIQLPDLINTITLEEISGRWNQRIHEVSKRIKEYGDAQGISLGTTFSGIFMLDQEYVIVHVGDTRIYQIHKHVDQLTSDHTYVAREIAAGRMTEKEAAHSPKRNTLLQCLGASKNLQPECRYGKVYPGDIFVICSDGFRHKISCHEMADYFRAHISEESLHHICSNLIRINMERGEKDNISVVTIKAY